MHTTASVPKVSYDSSALDKSHCLGKHICSDCVEIDSTGYIDLIVL